MRAAALLVSGLLALIAVPARAQVDPRPDQRCAHLWDGVIPAGVYLQGNVDGREVRGWLTHGEPVDAPERLHGVLIDVAGWRPEGRGASAARGFGGRVGEGCRLDLTETDDAGETLATWDVRLDADGLAGERRAMQTGAAAVSAVRLGRGRGIDCEGRGMWRLFRATDWPMTFRYPATWRLVASGNRLLLQCPDPGRIAAGDTPIVFTHTRVERAASDERRAGGFFSADGRRWLHGTGCPGDGAGTPFCAETRQSTIAGARVVQAAMPDQQLYAPGRGYIGLGPGLLRYLYLIGDDAVVLDTPDAPGWVGQFGAPGPVRFDGMGPGLRMAESVRPVATRKSNGR